MKIQIKKGTSDPNSVSNLTINRAEPLFGKKTITDPGNNTGTYDAIFIGANDSSEWKAVSMTEFSPSYMEVTDASIAPFSQYKMIFMTQAAYDALTSKDENTFYFITE